MKSREAILLSKVGKKKVPGLSANIPEQDGSDFRGIEDGLTDSGPFPTANTLKSSDILKAHKIGAGKVPKANILEDEKPSYEAEVEFGPTEVVKPKYSPIKNYLKKGK